jgi:hypothetical protein
VGVPFIFDVWRYVATHKTEFNVENPYDVDEATDEEEDEDDGDDRALSEAGSASSNASEYVPYFRGYIV